MLKWPEVGLVCAWVHVRRTRLCLQQFHLRGIAFPFTNAIKLVTNISVQFLTALPRLRLGSAVKVDGTILYMKLLLMN